MYFDRASLSNETLITFYETLLYPRLVEEKMLHLLRQGRISKWFSGIGQEAISVGATLAMKKEEWILPLHRNLGVFTARDLPLEKLFLQWEGHADGYTKGRDRSFHFGSADHYICGMISHLGPQLSIADGLALAGKLRHENRCVLVFSGEGATSEGEFHEALNLASVWGLPVIFLVENNGYALSTPVHEQFRCEKLSDRAKGYGMEGYTIEGNNILEVYHTIRNAREHCIKAQMPVLIECITFRMRGHEEASGTSYVPATLMEAWEKKDPLNNFADFLISEDIISPGRINEIKAIQQQQIEEELEKAMHQRDAAVNFINETKEVFAAGILPFNISTETFPEAPASKEIIHRRFIDALSEALWQAMEKYPGLILMGQDIAEYGGAFKITQGFLENYGKERVRNTPLCESAILGAALGLSLEGFKSVVEMQFSDFVTCGFNQIINNLAKIHYRWGQTADVVIRMPCGGGVGAGPFHSQTNEAWFTHTPGLKVVYPSSPEDAKGLLISAIEDPNPVLFFEHKALYRSISGPVPEAYYAVALGKARVVRQGQEAGIITYGMGVKWAMDYVEKYPEDDLYILDLRSLAPLDHEAIYECVKQTGKICILHEASITGGFGAELAAWIGEHCFKMLDAPVTRCASLDTPVPFSRKLENHYLPVSRLEKVMKHLLEY